MYIGNREYKTVQSWAKEINEHFKDRDFNLTPHLVHVLFQKYGLHPVRHPYKHEVQLYANHEVYAMFNGKERGNILGDAKKLSIDGTFGEPLKRGEVREIVPKVMPQMGEFPQEKPKKVKDTPITLNWQNGENDNDAYSQYLINNVYQNESKKRKITIGEETLKKLFDVL